MSTLNEAQLKKLERITGGSIKTQDLYDKAFSIGVQCFFDEVMASSKKRTVVVTGNGNILSR